MEMRSPASSHLRIPVVVLQAAQHPGPGLVERLEDVVADAGAGTKPRLQVPPALHRWIMIVLDTYNALAGGALFGRHPVALYASEQSRSKAAWVRFRPQGGRGPLISVLQPTPHLGDRVEPL